METQIDSVLVPNQYCISQDDVVKLFDEGYLISRLVDMAYSSKLFTKKQFARDYVCNSIRKSMLANK